MTIERSMAAGKWKANEQARFREAHTHMGISPRRLRLRGGARGKVQQIVTLERETQNEKASSASTPHIARLTFLDDTDGYTEATALSPPESATARRMQ